MGAGFKLKFPTAAITGYMTTKMKCFSTYSKTIDNGTLKLDFNTQMDFNNPNKQCMFGVSLNAGML